MVTETIQTHSEFRDWLPVIIQLGFALVVAGRMWERQRSHEKADELKHGQLDKKNESQDRRMDEIEDDVQWHGEQLAALHVVTQSAPPPRKPRFR